ncbi:uncharacterized protein LOC143276672 [Babylonia areolata]|uniref:uncharacterized protein LOC143276672 n=1 Tax=Babylonia areolata TaxID=304850 RepID=UPI003FCFC0F4
MAEKGGSYNTFSSQHQLTPAEQKKPMTTHKCGFLALIIFNVILLIALFALNGISAAGLDNGIFKSTVGNQSDKYSVEITPAGWTFSIWGFIYAWQALWVLYSVVNIFRKTPQGPNYISPPVLPPALFVTYILANCCNIAWLFLFDRDEIEASFVALLFIAIFLVAGMVVSYKSLEKFYVELLGAGRQVDIWLVRGFVHNGLGIYAAWTSIASLINLAIVITYTDGSDVAMTTACTIALGVLTVEILVFVSTDLLLLDRYSRYTFTPYIVVVVGLIGSISKNWESGATNSIFTAALLGLGSLALLIKIVVSIYRHKTRPPYHRQVVEPTLGADGMGKNMA